MSPAVFTLLHGMQTRSSDVCQYVCLSVWHTHMDCD